MAETDVLVVGPGAMGCLHAALLAEGGLRVGLLDHRPERAARIAAQGIVLERAGAAGEVQAACSAEAADFRPARLALILVKSWATEDAVRHALPACTDETLLLTLQNGLGNWERMAEVVPVERVLAGTTSTGATLLGEGAVRLAGLGDIRLGSPAGRADAARRAAVLLDGAGVPARAIEDVQDALWTKAVINAAINPLTALTGRLNGEMVEDAGLRRALTLVAEEAAGVARACGAELPEYMATAVEEVCRRTAGNRSSMLQDVSAGRRTEIEFINGEIVRRAAEVGVSAPLCEALTALVAGMRRDNSNTL